MCAHKYFNMGNWLFSRQSTSAAPEDAAFLADADAVEDIDSSIEDDDDYYDNSDENSDPCGDENQIPTERRALTSSGINYIAIAYPPPPRDNGPLQSILKQPAPAPTGAVPEDGEEEEGDPSKGAYH